jgi:hypothetical protein
MTRRDFIKKLVGAAAAVGGVSFYTRAEKPSISSALGRYEGVSYAHDDGSDTLTVAKMLKAKQVLLDADRIPKHYYLYIDGHWRVA